MGLAPIKIDHETDELVSDAARFLSCSKKQVVAEAVREYIDNHRDEINVGVKASLSRLNGSNSAALSLLTGFSSAKLNELGGVSS